jgi:phthiodiolone/phenolphthiodiolone dimycocerosates ketoreductase
VLTIGMGISVHPDLDPLEDVRWADDADGITAVWMLDHLQGWFPRGTRPSALADPHRVLDPFAVLAAAAVTSRRVRLGVAVTDPVRRSAVALAHTAASIGWLAGREMALGLGVGDPGQLLPFRLDHGRERTGRLHYMRPALQTLHALRTGGPIEAGGPDLALTSTSPFGVYVAAHGPKMLELTARYGTGWIPTSLPPESYAEKLGVVRQHAHAAGRDPAEITPTVFLWTALAPSRAESLALLEHPSVRAVALYRGSAGFAQHGATYPLPGGYVPHEIAPEQADAMLASIPDDVVRGAVLHGSPEDVREQLERYREAGCEHVVLYDIGRFADVEGTVRAREALSMVVKLG